MKTLAVIGVYGTGGDFATGQGVKCRTMVNWLKQRYGEKEVLVVNTYRWKRHPARLFFSALYAVAACRNILLMPAWNGIRVFAPLIAIVNRHFHRRVHYVVTGSELADFMEKQKSLKRYLSEFYGIYAQTPLLQRKLEEKGLANVRCLPNCRDYVESDTLPEKQFPPYRVCTYSRVVKDKGILEAVEICKAANRMIGSRVFTLDVYGKIDPEFKSEFLDACVREKETMRYCGIREAEDAVRIMREHFALLFPTYFYGECFAGTVLEAFQAGIPVIATDWKYNGEVIRDGVDGFLYPCHDNEAAAGRLVSLYHSAELYADICRECRERAKEYSTERVMDRFVSELA